jgi:hypothetical protein
MVKKLLAAVLGGLAFFLWSSVAHLFTGLGETGIQEIPNEPAVVSSIKANLPGSGLYLFPGWGLPPDATHSQKMAAMQKPEMQAKMQAGPTGLLVYRSTGMGGLTARQLITELVTNIVQIFLAVLLLVWLPRQLHAGLHRNDRHGICFCRAGSGCDRKTGAGGARRKGVRYS